MRAVLGIVVAAAIISCWPTDGRLDSGTRPQNQAAAAEPAQLEVFAPSKEPVRRPLFPPATHTLLVPPVDLEPSNSGDPAVVGVPDGVGDVEPVCDRCPVAVVPSPATRRAGHWETRRVGVFGRRVVRVWVH